MIEQGSWLRQLGEPGREAPTDGMILVRDYRPEGRPPEEVAIMERAAAYEAHSVFFQADASGRPPMAQAFVYVSDGPQQDPEFAKLHRRLWSWGGVPLIYRKTLGLVQLFRCAHQPDFDSSSGTPVCNPIKTLLLGAQISADPWWDAARLRNGSIWDDEEACRELLSADQAAHRRLIGAIKSLSQDLHAEQILPWHLRRRLLILCLLIAYLEDREVLETSFFGQFKRGAERFFEVLRDGKALVKMLSALEERFNGNVFHLDPADRARLETSTQLDRFARLIEGCTEGSGQRALWRLYSFRDLPVELVSNIYQLFVKNESNVAVYTPPFLVRLMLEESLGWERLDRIWGQKEVILDPACGSGVFLVEAYKRLILHFRSQNHWRKPTPVELRDLLDCVRGVDIEGGAIELAAFSLCLALCDALDTDTIRKTPRLFPALVGRTLHTGCFFAGNVRKFLSVPVGAVVGNPPFQSRLDTEGAQASRKRYEAKHGKGSLPDNQIAYLFLYESAALLSEGGMLCMLQPYGFLYNQKSLGFRRTFFQTWNVREILDFISIRGLFKKTSIAAKKGKPEKGPPDTKVVVVIAEAVRPAQEQQILHATFRRTNRVEAEQGFDIDSYDLHWLSRQMILAEADIFRCNLLGGARVHSLVQRLSQMDTLEDYAKAQSWDYGEGFNCGRRGDIEKASHIIGRPFVPSEAITANGLEHRRIKPAPRKTVEGVRSPKRFTPPMLLIREQMDLPHALWTKNYLTYNHQVVGFCAKEEELTKLESLNRFLVENSHAIRAYIATVSPRLFAQKATSISANDIYSIPYPKNQKLDLSENEQVVVKDIVDHYRDLIRLGQDAKAMKESAQSALTEFRAVYSRQLNGVYKNLRAETPYFFPGCICQPFVFGEGTIDWSGAETLREKLDDLLREKRGTSLSVTRIARIYDHSSIFLLKPDRLRYWLPSVALRDADDTLADLRDQGF